MKERFEALRKALIAERDAELAAYRTLLEEQPMKDRVAEGVTLYPVEFTDSRFNPFDELVLEFNVNPEQSGKLFGANGKCSLFSANQDERLEGIINQKRNNRLSVVLFTDELPDWIQDGKLGLNAICDTRTYDVQLKTLDELIEKNAGMAYRFYHASTKIFKPNPTILPEGLNLSQIRAVQAIESKAEFHVIHGPPGTGKTKTLVAAIEHLAKNELKILVAAPTNAAVDHITHELFLKDLKVLRYGSSFKIHEKVEALTLKSKVLHHPDMTVVARLTKEAHAIRKKAERYVRNFGKEEQEERRRLRAELKNLRRDIREIEGRVYASTLEQAQVICGTLIGLQQEEIRKLKFDLVVVDEAAQALEPAVWSAAAFAPILIMAGDPLQLPPSLHSTEAVKLGLGISIVEKAIQLGHPTTLLDTQYRMNDKIMQFSNHQFYDEKLQSAKHVADRKIHSDPFEPIEFIDTAGCGFDEVYDDARGISNPGEAQIVKQRLEADFENASVGIISPYRKQAILLNDLLPQYAGNIETVDSFQGQERDLIVISLVRSNTNGEIGFLKDYRRMNVAMTRARLKLIIIGDTATLGGDRF
jgi:ATP-dependent RNA/DNA helicase IGHMBP2